MALILAYAPWAGAVQLDWQAPNGCPTTEALLRDIRRLAGTSEGDSLTASAIVTETPEGRWRVAIDLAGSATGHRTLTADNCTQLARASALIIALAANPEAALDLANDEVASTPPAAVPADPIVVEPNPTPSVQPARVALPQPAVLPAPPPAASIALAQTTPVEERRRPPEAGGSLYLTSRAGVESGSLPTSTGWLGIGARTSLHNAPLGLAMSAFVTQGTSATFVDVGIGANFRGYGTQAALCIEPLRRRLYLSGCGGMQLTMVRAKGFVEIAELPDKGFERAVTFTRYRWIAAPVLGVLASFEFMPRVTVELGANLAAPTTRWHFVVENLGTMFRAAAVQYSFHMGVGLRLK